MMLDVLFKIKDEQDHTLSFRRSCRWVAIHCFWKVHALLVLRKLDLSEFNIFWSD